MEVKSWPGPPEHERASLTRGPTKVDRHGPVIVKDAGPWTPTVHSLLRHLEAVGVAGAPRVVGSGFDASGRETITYIEGELVDTGPWTLEGAAGVGRLVQELHQATASYRPPADAVWQRWLGRDLGGPTRIISHCDVAPWNIVAREGLPVALIDWEHAGPVDPLVELAQACWLNAKLHDDVVAEIDGLPPLAERARQLRAIVDAYGLPARKGRGFVDRIIEFVVCDTAEQADEANVMPETGELRSEQLGFNPLWALAWRARAGAWIVHHRRELENALS